MTKISMDKKYKTRDGKDVRILCIDAPNPACSVVALVDEIPYLYTYDGKIYGDTATHWDLIEVSPYEDFKIDDPVLVKNFKDPSWNKRHFAGISADGKPLAYKEGRTSWSSDPRHSNEIIYWDECIKPPYL